MPIQGENPKNNFNSSLGVNPPLLQSNSVLVQPSPLQMPPQLLFTSNTSSNPLSSPLPLLVSVTGVKTVNPFILVQSNVMTPSPLPTQKVVCSKGNARPIQPGPPNKAVKKLRKVPIPSLKQKAILSDIIPQSSLKKLTKRDPSNVISRSLETASDQTDKTRKVSKAKQSYKPLPDNNTDSSAGDQMKNGENKSIIDKGSDETQTRTCITMHEKNSESISDVDKENMAECSTSSKQECEMKKAKTTLSPAAAKGKLVEAKLVDILDSVNEVDVGIVSVKTLPHSSLNKKSEPLSRKEDTTSQVSSNAESLSSVNKRLCDEPIISQEMKRQKCDGKGIYVSGRKSNSECVSTSSPVKMSKSNYSISALCAQQQQLLQNAHITAQASDVVPLQQEILLPRSTASQNPKEVNIESRLEVIGIEETSSEKTNNNVCILTKSKEATTSSTDVYSEWPDKQKSKSDRVCTSYNLFSSLPIHNSKNTFIPITDIDGFKNVAEPFDATDNSFGLPLHSSDISNDIFASLQVPAGGQHPESISPTAAFLLAFPLVSTSKASELLSDETVCENTDSQPGMKTILQIGNLDCDTPVTKCVSVFASVESSNVVYSASNEFSQDALSGALTKTKTIDPTVDTCHFMQKDSEVNPSHKSSSNGTVMLVKDGTSFVHKNAETSSTIKDGQSFLSKNDFQPPCSSSNKETCLVQSQSSSIISESNQPNAQLGNAQHTKQSETQLSSARDNLTKTSLKLNSSHESTPFLTCDKPTEWIDMPHTSQTTFPDYSTPSSTRSDCAVNYVLPPVLMSSSTSGEELLSGSRSNVSSSSGGILSWSTLPPSDNHHSSKTSQRLVHLHDVYPSSKSSNKSVEGQQMLPNPIISTTVSNYSPLAGTVSAVDNKLNSILPNYNQNNQVVVSSKSDVPSSYDHRLSSNQKQGTTLQQNSSSAIFISSGRNSEPKKTFPVTTERKAVECSTSQVIKTPHNASENVLYSHRQSDLLRQATSQPSSSAMMFSSSDGKSGKASSLYYNEGISSQSMKPGMDVIAETHDLKQSITLLNYNQSVVAPELKQTSFVSTYSHGPNINIKENIGQSHIMNSFNHQTNHLQKEHATSSSQYPSGVPDPSDPKKNASHFNHNNGAPMVVSKQTTSGLNFNLENASSMMQCNNSSVILAPGHQQSYNKPISHEESLGKPQPQQSASGLHNQQRQSVNSHHQQQQCGRLNNKESVTNLHRPPVNWMTAPDIRSHQHHSGPSFGNSAGMNSTQGLMYMPEHIKDSDSTTNVFDQSTNFHCLDISHSGQPLYKGNELHLFGNENIENFHDNAAWSPSKNGGSSMLGNMMIPSTLPTLVGDLALGDSNISRPFLPSYSNDPPSCIKKSNKRTSHNTRRGGKTVEETSVSSGQECGGSFLSVSQLVDSGNASKTRTGSSTKENILYTGPFTDHDSTVCQSSKQSTSKTISSNYSTEALLSSSNAQQINQLSLRKRRAHGTHYSNNYVGTSTTYQNGGTVTLQAQGPQTQFLTDIPAPRTNEYQGTFLHSDSVPSFMLGNPSRSHRCHSYSLQNITDRPNEDNSNVQRIHHSGLSDNTEANSGGTSVRHRSSNNNSVVNSSGSVTVSSSNIIDFGYMSSAVLQDDLNFSNHHPPPHPPFLSHHTYPIPAPQDALYSAPRLSMHPTHPPQNSNIQSPSATTLTNFHLSTIFPEINEKVIC